MHIVHISPEFTPICKVGGLADVVSGLSLALVGLSHDVTVILPKYDSINVELQPYTTSSNDYDIFFTRYKNVKLIFIDTAKQGDFFQRGTIYGGKDEILRFLHFTKGVAQFLQKEFSERIDVLHLHDWTAASLFLFLSSSLKQGMGKIIFTIHNLQYQGRLHHEKLSQISFLAPFLDHPHLYDDEGMNLLKLGMAQADAITVVSPSYAKEVCKKEFGCGLSKEMNGYRSKTFGILNGIDYEYWSLEKDPDLFERIAYTSSIEKIIQCKKHNKLGLFHKLQLKENSGPCVCAITRMVKQKGPHLIKHALEFTRENRGNFILLFATIDEDLQEDFNKIIKTYQSHPHIHIYFGFDEALAHQTYAAADMIVIPSEFEPCGLTQMIAMRYGTIPIVHSVGGLIDTVGDIEDSSIPKNKQNGFTFSEFSIAAMDRTMRRAFLSYYDEKTWNGLMQRAITSDFSWPQVAEKYLKIYRS